MKATPWVRSGLAGLLLTVAAPALGQGLTPSPDSGLGQAVPAESLADQRGGAETLTMNLEEISNEINENARLSGNRVGSNVTTGANRISGGSFAGSSGISSVIQNTGNNVIIQDSTQVNITMKP